ncbi:hypothetical protein M2323_000492 [Rhodoblastus acidophilus]|uniref:hypothetical protein n=1 Tax=Rhodoblastus acidophilus TaxID=1074 RepID=UPI0022253D71|nr:hypothetical protein [Rhodoblastus acidophilus]MCW2282727.1 hypothetical protein [Rhodoblastus acidophilus]MCW2331588.1 hypothetical protein [Rhodoblastus acidophilus]
MSSDIFVDRLVDIAVTGGVVRLDFANLSPAQKRDDGQPALVFSQRVVLPIEAFVELGDTVAKMISIMVEKGTLVKREASGGHAEGVPN